MGCLDVRGFCGSVKPPANPNSQPSSETLGRPHSFAWEPSVHCPIPPFTPGSLAQASPAKPMTSNTANSAAEPCSFALQIECIPLALNATSSIIFQVRQG